MAPCYKGTLAALQSFILLSNTIVLVVTAPIGKSCKNDRVILTNKTGTIVHGSSEKYTSFARCEWLINAGSSRKSILLQFDYLYTECSYDYLFIYDGYSYNSTKIASLSGNTTPKTVLAKSGYMLVFLFSDRNYVLRGFRANYSIIDCPFDCNNRGRCVNYSCFCDKDYVGESCEYEICPNSCSGHGECVVTGDKRYWGCRCHSNYAGISCNLPLLGEEGKLKWLTLMPSVTNFTNRFKHSAVFRETDGCVYVFGGNTHNAVLNDLVRFCLQESKWESLLKNDFWPSPRYDHGSGIYGDGMFVFGGLLSNGSHCNELWFYDMVKGNWTLHAKDSVVKPPGLSGHTVTLVNDVIYVIGGKTDNGLYSPNIYSINATMPDTWNIVQPTGGRGIQRLLHGHSAVYHKETSSIIIYGGIAARSARFTNLSNKLFTFNVINSYWSEIEYRQSGTRTFLVPLQRAHHTALIIGNYMVVYGGYVHIHNKEEVCYDEGIYMYHLGCHQWVNHSLVHKGSSLVTTPQRGRFGHIAVLVNGNIMVVVGGFSGYSVGDVTAFKFPGVVAPPNSELQLDRDYCLDAYSNTKFACFDDPECMLCESRLDIGRPGCVHRTRPEMCNPNEKTYKLTPCYGICSHLTTCQACLSQGQGVTLTSMSPRRRFYQEECSWCVKNSTCQRRAVPEGSCQAADGTLSGIVGWWNGLSPSWTDLQQCSKMEIPGGVQWMKYYHPANFSQPDEVEFLAEIQSTIKSEKATQSHEGEGNIFMISHYHGYIWPLNAPPASGMSELKPYVSAKNAHLVVWISNDSSVANKQILQTIPDSQVLTTRLAAHDPGLDGKITPVFPNVSRGYKYYFYLEAKAKYQKYGHHSSENATVKIEWNADVDKYKRVLNSISIEFLEPFHSHSCKSYSNCMACMTDASCGWCTAIEQCMLKGDNSSSECWGPELVTLLITHPELCDRCPDYVDCRSCSQVSDFTYEADPLNMEIPTIGLKNFKFFSAFEVRGKSHWFEFTLKRRSPSESPPPHSDPDVHVFQEKEPLCEWKLGEEQCFRRGRFSDTQVVRNPHNCSIPCYMKTNCSTCISVHNDCFWCETTQTCFPFAHYSSHFIHGECQDWMDHEGQADHQCQDCSSLLKCEDCLSNYRCGWCGDSDNALLGMCVKGDFSGPHVSTCTAVLTEFAQVGNWSFSGHVNWTYDSCLDVDECRLGLHKCHENALCVNTDKSYQCHCNRGYKGNGTHCTKTCYYDCANGTCSGAPDYKCICNLGWTGSDCNTSCGCNFHSTCNNGTGICDDCQFNTAGQFCEKCRFGYYGNHATGCRECDCNKHGNISMGICHNETGKCFCTGNTEGVICQHCAPGHFGSPANGGKCYRQCDGRIVLNQSEGSLGLQLPRTTETPSNLHCLWIIEIPETSLQPDKPSSISVNIDNISTVCQKEHVMIYDGVPPFISGNDTNARLLGSFCGNSGAMVTAKSRRVTVYFEMDLRDFNEEKRNGFKISYYVNQCDKCGKKEMCVKNRCECDPTYRENNCSYKMCHVSCNYDQVHDECVCNYDKFQGQIFPWYFPYQRVSDTTDKQMPARYGHIVTACGEDLDTFYVFGGYSLETGPLNDIWMFNITSRKWSQVSPLTSDAPEGRYFHAGVCIPTLKEIYVYGGLKKSGGSYIATNEFWKFAIGPRMWTNLTVPETYNAVAGHTMTLSGETNLIIIGGISDHKYFSDRMYEYDASIDGFKAWQEFTHKRSNIPLGIYGHSAVFDSQSSTIYIFGGMQFKNSTFQVSNDLYTFSTVTKECHHLQTSSSDQVKARIFHTAVKTGDSMLVAGGVSSSGYLALHWMLYRFQCNTWMKPEQFVYLQAQYRKTYTEDEGQSDSQHNLNVMDDMHSDLNVMAASSIYLQGRVYIVGGFNGVSHNQIITLTIPSDSCALITHRAICNQTLGCSFCFSTSGSAVCYTNNGHKHKSCSSIIHHSPNGLECSARWYEKRDCSSYHTCQTCLAENPYFRDKQTCSWCSNCNVCTNKSTCPAHCELNKISMLKSALDCVKWSLCTHADCSTCLLDTNECSWTNCVTPATDNVWQIDNTLQYSWRCAPKSFSNACQSYDACHNPCSEYKDCEICQNAFGIGGGSIHCVWSSVLHECFDQAILPLKCYGGECGMVLQDSHEKCMTPCSNFQVCAECIKAPWCGWCAFAGYTGDGLCMEGGRDNPTGEGSCREDLIRRNKGYMPIDLFYKKSKGAPTWAYTTCPPENECANTHHECDNESQDCYDTLTGYNCTCKSNYLKDADSGKCKPHCHSKCEHGFCVRPDVCECDFGYVGIKCDKACNCHKHSNCPNEFNLDTCDECKNHTTGKQCQSCESLYVGDPEKSEPCISCFKYCNNHTATCVSMEMYSNATMKYLIMHNPAILSDPKFIGPKPSRAICIDCKNNTAGERCDRCKEGYFRVNSKNPKSKTEACIKCQCNGHSDICKNETGEGCQCMNNTETPVCKQSSSDPLGEKCWQKQCSKCKEYFMGQPTRGHHCYRQMTVDKEYCFDPKTQRNCNQNPGALFHGRTVLFAVPPRYLNVDIRITIDVTFGAADIYFSSSDKTFTINVDKRNGTHYVILDPDLNSPKVDTSHRGRRSVYNATSNTTHPYLKQTTTGFHSYHTVKKTGTILQFRNVQSRLVVTLPLELHDLRVSKFYLIIYGVGNSNSRATYGSLYFRQDQPHIDLFVFFSVFFSSFFLFLAKCVILWKVKQAVDAQRSRQRQQKEMIHMASRPFAKVLVLLEPEPVVISSTPVPRKRVKSNKISSRNLQNLPPLPPVETPLPLLTLNKSVFKKEILCPFDVVPIAAEPTSDNQAALKTVVLQLPGDHSAPSKLCLGTCLTLQNNRTNYSSTKCNTRQRSNFANC